MEKEKQFSPNPQYQYYEYTLPEATIFSGIKVSNLKVLTPAVRGRRKMNPQWPVTRYLTSVILGHSGKETLAALHRHITACWKKSLDKIEENFVTWQQGRVTVRLNTYKKKEFDTYDAECTLLIDYEPDLTSFYTNLYQQRLTLGGAIYFKSLPVCFEILADYTRASNVYYTPECFVPAFDDSHESLIWVDEPEQKTGFANRHFCLIFANAQCKELLLETCYWRDQLSGYTLYCRASKRQDWHRVTSFAPVAGFSADALLNQLSALTGVTCSTTEDWQYY